MKKYMEDFVYRKRFKNVESRICTNYSVSFSFKIRVLSFIGDIKGEAVWCDLDRSVNLK